MVQTLGILCLMACAPGRFAMAYEEAPYRTIESYEDFEIREYQSFIVAEVIVTEGFGKAGNSAFRILFDYISGNNVPSQNISMTAPVSQKSVQGQKIEMTTPVLQVPSDSGLNEHRFSFVMPSEYTLETLPSPNNENITIREVPSRMAAARQFSGSWSQSNFNKNKTVLMQNLAARKIKIMGEPEYARYNSPFTLWFLRRNEVIVDIEK